jgi:hypothetical protein
MRDEKGQAVDAILFSANPDMVRVDDARKHLADHKELYWSVGSRLPNITSLTRFTDSFTSVGEKSSIGQPFVTSFLSHLDTMKIWH